MATLGKMLWFNEAKGVGVIEGDDGRRFSVDRNAFVGDAPIGRCAGLVVSFTASEDEAVDVMVVPDSPQRRARTRRSGRAF